MKKLLLSGLAVVSFMTTSFAQTLLTDFDAGAGSITTDNTAWYSYSACDGAPNLVVNTAAGSSSGNYLKAHNSTPVGVGAYYIGGVGFDNSAAFGLGSTINNLAINLFTDGTDIQLKVQLFDATTHSKQYVISTAIPAASTGWTLFNIPFSDLLDGSAAEPDPTAVTKIEFQILMASGDGSGTGTALIDNITFSTGALTSTSKASNIASSKLYPNPVSDNAKVELNLKSSSNVKVTLSDVMGKEVMTIADGSFTELAKDFSVANLNKGIYTVNYYINGEASKAELLMVK